MYRDITELFVFVDDFCKAVDRYDAGNMLADQAKPKPTRTPEMSVSEILVIMILFQKSPCKNFKYFFISYLKMYHQDFPRLVSYNRFVELQKRCLPYLFLLMQWFCLQTNPQGEHFVDATHIRVCHNKRISSHKVFKGFAALGKSTMGWFLGFKLHLVINAKGEIQGVMLTAGNVDDRTPVSAMTQRLRGLLLGDKGYINQTLFEELYARGLKLITNVRAKMKNKFMTMEEKMLLRKRSIIETVYDLLKNTFQLVHTRHRSVSNFLVHIVSTLVAYCFRSNKPKIKFNGLIPN